MGKISKVVLQDICATFSIALNINQWCNMNHCIKWFRNYSKNDKCFSIKFGIKEFYPSIIEKKTVNEEFNLVREYLSILKGRIKIMKHTRKSLLYSNEVLWIKKELVLISITLARRGGGL